VHADSRTEKPRDAANFIETFLRLLLERSKLTLCGLYNSGKMFREIFTYFQKKMQPICVLCWQRSILANIKSSWQEYLPLRCVGLYLRRFYKCTWLCNQFIFNIIFHLIQLCIYHKFDRLCGLAVRISGYRSSGSGLIPGTTGFSEK
jgi:hypothetical protein